GSAGATRVKAAKHPCFCSGACHRSRGPAHTQLMPQQSAQRRRFGSHIRAATVSESSSPAVSATPGHAAAGIRSSGRACSSAHTLTSMEAILSKLVLDLRFKDKKVGSVGWALLVAALLAHAQPASTPVLPSFDRVLLLEEKGETSAGVSVGDLNGDGLPDIVLGKGRHWPLFNRVLLNDGHGGFTATNLGTAPDRTYSAALADVDGDGFLDIIVSNDAADRKLVYRNDGKGHFTEFGTFGDPKWSTRYVTLADLNGDGYPDIVAANRGDYPDLVNGKPGKGPHVPTPSYVCLNDGKGHFPACQPLPKTESATSIVVADFDGDGALDLFVPHRDGGQS